MTLWRAASRQAARASRLATGANNSGRVLPSSKEAIRCQSTLTREDVVDSDGLLQFKTLHEMNRNATIAFRDNELFGTHRAAPQEENFVKDQREKPGKFEWMTYGEYGELADRCRTVLKDLGELWEGSWTPNERVYSRFGQFKCVSIQAFASTTR